jgi:hypothetical protein
MTHDYKWHGTTTLLLLRRLISGRYPKGPNANRRHETGKHDPRKANHQREALRRKMLWRDRLCRPHEGTI